MAYEDDAELNLFGDLGQTVKYGTFFNRCMPKLFKFTRRFFNRMILK